MCKVSAVNSLKLPHDQLRYMGYDVVRKGIFLDMRIKKMWLDYPSIALPLLILSFILMGKEGIMKESVLLFKCKACTILTTHLDCMTVWQQRGSLVNNFYYSLCVSGPEGGGGGVK